MYSRESQSSSSSPSSRSRIRSSSLSCIALMNSSSPVAPTLAVHLAKCLVQLLLKCTAPMSLIPSSWSSVGMRVAGALLESAMLLTIVLTAFLVAEVAAAAAAADAAAAAGSAIRSCCSTIEGVQSQSVPGLKLCRRPRLRSRAGLGRCPRVGSGRWWIPECQWGAGGQQLPGPLVSRARSLCRWRRDVRALRCRLLT